MDHKYREGILDLSDDELDRHCAGWNTDSEEYRILIQERNARHARRTKELLEKTERHLDKLNRSPHPVLIWTLVFTGLCFLASAVAATPVVQSWIVTVRGWLFASP